MKRVVFLAVCLFLTANILGQQLPYQNPKLSSEERATDLISRLTLIEKASLMKDESDAVPRLGIKKFNWWSEALHGLANNDKVTVFPEPIGMAASFDDELLYRVFTAVSTETRAKYNEAKQKGLDNRRFLSLSVWTPNINIFRDPRWGRGQETYGEDPYLTTRMGISVVEGLQGPDTARYKKLLACAKHFAVHSGPESTRHTLNVNNVDPRDLRETYLPAFKSLVQDAGVREVMCAYQRLDDEPCCGNSRLLERILREEWGFKYVVVSDCGAIADFFNSHKVSSDPTHAAAKGVLAGTDVECAGPAYKMLPQAVEKGLINEEDMNKSLMRIFEGRFDLGEMDDDAIVPWSKIPVSIVNCDEHKKLSLDMAHETMTLLQNKNNILPLSKATKIAVIGPNANEKRVLWGNYNGTPFNTITILDGIKTKVAANRIFYDRACDLTEKVYVESVIGKCSFEGKPGIKATYWNNRDFSGNPVTTERILSPIQLTTEGAHQFGQGVSLDNFCGRYETVYKATESGDLVFRFEAGGRFEIIVNGDTLYKPRRFGFGSRSTRLAMKVEKDKEYKITSNFIQFGTRAASLNLNFGNEMPVQFSDLILRLKGIDVVIFAGGISSQLEGEQMPVDIPGFKGGDRTDIELPEIQRSCLQALKQAGKKVIFVNLSGSSMGFVPETESCDAILQAWYGGEAGGQAVADVLFGDYNPSGKLPVTFYKSIKQLGDFEDYSMKGRTYRFMSDPLFPFGYGLSYTTFSIGEAKPDKNQVKSDESLDITIPVINTGKKDGTEVVQVYVHKVNDTDGPIRTLRGFQRVKVAAGKTQNITISLPYKSFEFFNRAKGKIDVTSGEYEIWYGNSSAAKDLKMLKVIVI
jgi:beta-glucosidase